MVKTFIDIGKEQNLRDGIQYFATGLITGENEPSISGKDYVVEYIDPWGEFQREWRAIDEVEVIEIDDDEALPLKEALREAEMRSEASYYTAVDHDYKVHLFRTIEALGAVFLGQGLVMDREKPNELASARDIAQALSRGQTIWLYDPSYKDAKVRIEQHLYVFR